MVTADPEASILNGEFQVVLTAPEMLFKKQWRYMLTYDIYTAFLKALWLMKLILARPDTK